MHNYLKKVDEIIEKKRAIAHKYNSLLKDIEGITIPPEKPNVKNVYWMYGILIEDEFGVDRDTVKQKLFEAGIDTRFFFAPLHGQPCFAHNGYNTEEFPVTKSLSKKGFYLPSAITLKDEEIAFICETLKKIKEDCAKV